MASHLRFPIVCPTFRALVLCLLVAVACPAAVDVGSGAPTPQITDRFVNAYFRNGFNNLVSLPPIDNVKKLGSTGLVQEFFDNKKTVGSKLALVMPDANGSNIYQVLGDLYPLYSMVGVAVAGYPTGDEAACPGANGAQCTYQLFSLGYALFAYQSLNNGAQSFSLGGVFYTKWNALGGVTSSIGFLTSDAAAVTSSFKTTAMVQSFTGGVIYDITSGALSGQTFALSTAVNNVYIGYGGPAGFLGLPTSDETVLTSGLHRQTFEGGRFEFLPGQTPALLSPITTIQFSVAGPLTLHLGDVAQVTANTFTDAGPATGRTVTFVTSNSRVVTIQQSGATATLKAVGAGAANITATSEGKVSSALAVTVIGQCCAVGEGSPSAQVSQAFQDEVTRTRISVLLPAPNPVQRVGTGYVQDLVSAQAPAVRYYLTKSDRSAMAYLVTGGLLTAYLAAGGPAGALGYPSSDASPGGTQLFENGAALAGNPIHVVSGVILTKWAALGYETGTAGPPAGDPAPFSSLSAYNGVSQVFSKGVIYGITNGNRNGQGYFVGGLIQMRYAALGGPAGTFGIPVSDEFSISGMRRQNFEDGYIDYSPGDPVAQDHVAPRQPAIGANPAAVVAGSRLRLTVTGFANGSTLRISVAGQPDFLVTTPNGSYDWDTYVPASSKSGAVALHAVDVNGGAAADGSYSVKTLVETHPQIVKLQGDGQSGAPGTLLPQPLRVSVQDASGTPIAGVSVLFQASGGAQISPVSAVTDANGQASAMYRLPTGIGVSAATATAGGQVATFNFRTAGSTIASFPQFTQSDAKGGLVAAMAAMLRFYQNRGDLTAPRGLADPAALSQYLKTLPDGFVSNPADGEQVANPWRAASFAGGAADVSIENPDLSAVRDLIAAGNPVLLTLALTSDGVPAGGAAVVAIGVGNDGGIAIQDPNSAFARTSLSDYLAGFAAAGHAWQGTVLSAMRFAARTPSATGFLISAVSQSSGAVNSLAALSIQGPCGRPLDVPDLAVAAAANPAAVPVTRFLYCDGTQAAYQISAAGGATVTDLGAGGLSQPVAGTYKATRTNAALVVGPQDVSFAAASVVNAASFASGIAPGGLFSIFGSGLGASEAPTSVSVGGTAARVLSSSAFQINAQAPPGLAPGTYDLQVQSALGTATQPVELQAAAPGIFVLGTDANGQTAGAVVNQDGTVNSPSTPARRGDVITVYCTGLGAVVARGNLNFTTGLVRGVLNGTELPSAFSGLTPGFIGLYQVNILVPAATPPGMGQTLLLRESNVDSNTVFVAIQ